MDEEELRGLVTALDRIEDTAVAATGKDEDSRIGEVYAAYDLLVSRETPLRRTPVTAFAAERPAPYRPVRSRRGGGLTRR